MSSLPHSTMYMIYLEPSNGTVRVCSLTEDGERFIDQDQESNGLWNAWSDSMTADELCSRLVRVIGKPTNV